MVCEPVQIGPYRLVRKLGQGGMGEVFEAIHESLARRVALKRMLPRFAHDSRANRRFIKEARAVNLIGHPGLVQVSDFCVLPDGSPYLVMEYLQGETLAERLRDLSRPLSLQQVVHICWQLSSILSATHAKGIVHRDLKPENVMLVCDPLVSIGLRVKLLDFGIARFETPTETLTTEQGMLGTPMYMSPEQCRGTGSVGTASDVYSFGVLLYRLLAGHPPFQSAGIGELVVMHMLRSPPPIPSIFPALPDSLRELVMRMLAKEQSERPSIEEIEMTLEGLVTQHGAVATAEAKPLVGMARKSLSEPPLSGSLADPLGSDIEPEEPERPREPGSSIEHLSSQSVQRSQTDPDRDEEGLSDRHLGAMRAQWTRRLVLGVSFALSIAAMLLTVWWSHVRVRSTTAGALEPVIERPADGTLSVVRGLTYSSQPNASEPTSAPLVPAPAKEQKGTSSHEQSTVTSHTVSSSAVGRVHQPVNSHRSIAKPDVAASGQAARKTAEPARNPQLTTVPTRQIPPSPVADSDSHGTVPFLVID